MRLPVVVALAFAAVLVGCTHKPDPRAMEHVKAGEKLYRQGQAEAAAEEMTKALSYDPGCAAAHFYLGVIFEDNGLLKAAASEYEAAARSAKDFVDAHLFAADSLDRMGQYEAALPHYRAVASLRPADADVANSLAACYFRLGRFEEAASTWRRAITLRPNFASAHANLGSAYWRMGDFDAALAEFRKAVQLDPTNATARSKLAFTLMHNKHAYDEAIPVLVAGLRTHPDDIRLLSLAGVACSEAGRPEQARKYYERALEAGPDTVELMSNLAGQYAFMGVEMQRALELARRAVQLDPDGIIPLSTLAYVYLRDGRLDDAKTVVDEGLAVDAESGLMRYVESLLLAQEGKKDAALESLRAALEADGGVARRAMREPALTSLREDPAFAELVGPYLAPKAKD